MASLVPHMPNYVHVIMRLKMLEIINGISDSLMCHYVENVEAFPIGSLVEPYKTLMDNAIRHCRHLVHYRFNDRLYVAKVLDG